MKDALLLKEVILVIAVIMPRFVGMLSILPFMGKSVIQGMVRNSLVLCFAPILYPVVRESVPPNLTPDVFFLIMVKEVIIGVLIGYLVSMLFWIAESVGFFIDNQRGASMATTMDPMSGSQTSPLGSMLMQLIAVLFMSGGGFLALMGGMIQSYKIWPVFTFMPALPPEFALFILNQVDHFMYMTVLLASPIIVLVFLVDLGMGLINRFAPSLNVFFLSMPIKSAVASFMLIIYVFSLVSFLRAEELNFNYVFALLQKQLGGP